VNNLGGQGPDLGKAEEIRYAGIGSYGTEPFDLVVTTHSEYTPKRSAFNGQNGMFGQINLAVGSSVDLMFSLQNRANQPLQLNSFYFSFFDIDEGTNNHEKICLATNAYHETHLAPGTTEIKVVQSGGQTCFVSTERGFELP
jgi:hypothetical protein